MKDVSQKSLDVAEAVLQIAQKFTDGSAPVRIAKVLDRQFQVKAIDLWIEVWQRGIQDRHNPKVTKDILDEWNRTRGA